MLSYCPGAGQEETPNTYDVFTPWLVLVQTNWDKIFRATAKEVVYVARYGAQSINDVDDWPTSKIHRIARILNESIKEEGGGLRSNAGAF